MKEKIEYTTMLVLSIPAQLIMLPFSLIIFFKDRDFWFSTWCYAMGVTDLVFLWIWILSLIFGG